MTKRLLAVTALGAALALGASGCSMITPQSTTYFDYSTAGGINVPDSSGPIQVRNALIVANQDGSDGNFVAALVNTDSVEHTIYITINDGENAKRGKVSVPANEIVSLGAEDTNPLYIPDLKVAPGATVSMSFASGNDTEATVDIPVLNGHFKYLEDLVPTPEPSSSY